jgi:hypothetical protein
MVPFQAPIRIWLVLLVALELIFWLVRAVQTPAVFHRRQNILHKILV